MRSLKWIVLILMLGLIVVVAFRCNQCGNLPKQMASSKLSPKDTNYAVVSIEQYRPPSLPLQKDNPPALMPEGVKERDVRRVVSVSLRPTDVRRTIDLIETKDGNVYLRKDSSIISITVTEFQPQAIAFSFQPFLGASFGFNNGGLKTLPIAGLSLLKAYGCADVPFIALDPQGAGVGVAVKIHREISLGIARMWYFSEGTGAKLTIHYSL